MLKTTIKKSMEFKDNQQKEQIKKRIKNYFIDTPEKLAKQFYLVNLMDLKSTFTDNELLYAYFDKESYYASHVDYYLINQLTKKQQIIISLYNINSVYIYNVKINEGFQPIEIPQDTTLFQQCFNNNNKDFVIQENLFFLLKNLFRIEQLLPLNDNFYDKKKQKKIIFSARNRVYSILIHLNIFPTNFEKYLQQLLNEFFDIKIDLSKLLVTNVLLHNKKYNQIKKFNNFFFDLIFYGKRILIDYCNFFIEINNLNQSYFSMMLPSIYFIEELNKKQKKTKKDN